MVTIKDWHMINAIVKIIIQRNQRLQIYNMRTLSWLLFIANFDIVQFHLIIMLTKRTVDREFDRHSYILSRC